MTVVVEGAPRKPIRFEVLDDACWPAVHKILKVLSEDLGAVIEIEDPPEAEPERAPVCAVCEHTTTEVHYHEALHEEICLVCWRAADRLVAQFNADLVRHEREFRGQLKQMVRDVRAGADDPTFYRGFDG